MPAVILVGGGGGGVFTHRFCAALSCSVIMLKHVTFCRRQSLLVGYMKQKNCSAVLDLLLSKVYLNHSIAPELVNNFSRPGVYILLVAVLGSSVSLPLQ